MSFDAVMTSTNSSAVGPAQPSTPWTSTLGLLGLASWTPSTAGHRPQSPREEEEEDSSKTVSSPAAAAAERSVSEGVRRGWDTMGIISSVGPVRRTAPALGAVTTRTHHRRRHRRQGPLHRGESRWIWIRTICAMERCYPFWGLFSAFCCWRWLLRRLSATSIAEGRREAGRKRDRERERRMEEAGRQSGRQTGREGWNGNREKEKGK